MPKKAKNIDTNEFNIDNYDKFINNQPHRGVIIYTHHSLKATEITFDNTNDFQESVTCEIKTTVPGVSLLFACIYRSPNSDRDNNDKILKLLQDIDNHPAKLKCITGDFNMPGIDWETGDTRDNFSNRFYECSLDLFLKQNVKDTTRNIPGQTPSLLDLIFSNDDNLIQGITHRAPLGKSDHDIITFELNVIIPRYALPDSAVYDKGKYDEFRSFVYNFDWSDMKNSNLEESWSLIKNTLKEGISQYIPKRKAQNVTHKPPWLNKEATVAIKRKNNAYKKYRMNKSHYNEHKYRTQRNIATNEVRKAKQSFEQKIAKECKKNPKAFWRYIKSKTIPKANIGNLKYNGKVAETDIEKAEILNSFLRSVYNDEDTGELPEAETTTQRYNICELRVTPQSVEDKLLNLNPNKSAGPDGLHPRILRELAGPLAIPVCNLMNKCFEQGKIPEEWKDSNVTCIYKKGDKTDPGNYRPVSLTCILSKVAESFVKEYVYNYLETTDYLCEEQHGFRSHRSCTTQLLLFSEILSKRIEDGLDTDVIYLDFQKAFDKVSHRRLLLKVEKAGIQGPICDLIKDFLSNRKHRINVNGSYSSKSSVKSGIPQGSILRPLLFIIFINDLPNSIKNHCMMFADDTKIFGNPGSSLQLDINRADEWAQKWKMKFNVNKCKVLHFNKGENNQYDYYMVDQHTMCKMTATPQEKDIGVIFDNNLQFNSHITTTVNKCQQILSIIKRSFDFIDENIMTLLYSTLVRPIIEYSNVIWAPHLRKHINMMEAVQRRATRMVPNLKNLNYHERLKKLNLYSLAYRRRRGDLIQVFKLMHSIDNVDYSYLFEINNTTTRGHKLKLKKQFCKTNCRKYSFSQRVINDWNSLPQSVVQISNLNTFKTEIDNFFAINIYDI